MRVTVWRREGLICQLRPRKSIWWSALRRRPKCRARWRSTRVGAGQGWRTRRRSCWAFAGGLAGAERGGGREGAVLVGQVGIEQGLREGVVGDFLVSQECD